MAEHAKKEEHQKSGENSEGKGWGENIKVAEEKKGEDEDIEIDLSKAFGFLKKKKKDATATTSAAVIDKSRENSRNESDDKEKSKGGEDEIDLGKAFSGIKNAFKGLAKKEKATGTSESGDDSVDVTGAVDFLKKNYSVILLALAVIVSAGLGFQIRMQAGDLDFANSWASNSVQNTMQQDISAAVSQQYPNLPDSNRNSILSQELDKANKAGTYTFRAGQYAGQTMDIKQQVEQTSKFVKAFFQDEQGRNYMPDIDPYYWLRYAQNILEKGQIGDEVKNGLQWDNHQLAPTGRAIVIQDTLYPEIIANFHRLFGWIGGGNLTRTLMFLPVLFSAITSLVVFMIARRIAGNVAAFFAATMVGVHGALLNRTMFGHADSDALVVLLSVLILWLFIESFAAKNLRAKLAFAALAGLATGVYSRAWGGWWWIFDFTMASAAITLGLFVLYELFLESKRNGLSANAAGKALQSLKGAAARSAITATAVYLAVTGISVSIFVGFRTFLITPLTSIGFAQLKTPVLGELWPNVLRTVAELNQGTLSQAIGQIGKPLFYMAALGILLIILRSAWEAYKGERDNRKIITDIFSAVVLTIWFIVTLYSVTKGIRFVLLLVPAFSIAFGTLFGLVQEMSSKWIIKEFKFNALATKAVLFLILFAVFPGITLNSNVVNSARSAAQNDMPIINDAWHNALTAIKENSQENAIITSWWDFGHHFKQIADRPVTFDGTTQQSEVAHWVGRFFMTNNEDEAAGILRMLDCGRNNAFHEVDKKLDSNVKSIALIKRIILLDKNEAGKALEAEGLSSEEASKVLEYSHCNPPEAFVIASEDMIGKSGVWAHFGGWNFTKAAIWRDAKDLNQEDAVQYMQEKLGLGKDEAEKLYFELKGLKDDAAADAWISPWPSFAGAVNGCTTTGSMVKCGDGLNVNLEDYNAWYPLPEGNRHPVKLVYALPDGTVVEKQFRNDTLPQGLAALLIPVGKNSYNSVLASPEVAGGMFARLFYFQGHGLAHFKLLTRQRGLTGTDVFVWQVDWEGKQRNIHPALVEKKSASTGDTVTLNFIGYFEDGSVFDTSIAASGHGNLTNETPLDEGNRYSPITVTTGQGSLIQGLEEGILGMKPGEEKWFVVPPEKGYQDPRITPFYNKTLYFRVKVTDIQ